MRDKVAIFGTDYQTPDGTCLRDYIHVEDLATAHVLALKHLVNGGGSRIYILAAKKASACVRLLKLPKKVTGVDFTVTEEARRSGDPCRSGGPSSAKSKSRAWLAAAVQYG